MAAAATATAASEIAEMTFTAAWLFLATKYRPAILGPNISLRYPLAPLRFAICCHMLSDSLDSRLSICST